MTVYRRYVFDRPGTYAEDAWDVAWKALRWNVASHWWYDDPLVEGKPFSRLVVGFTVSARDQWFAHRRAMALIDAVYWPLKLRKLSDVPEPLWEPLDPDAKRGRPPVKVTGLVA